MVYEIHADRLASARVLTGPDEAVSWSSSPTAFGSVVVNENPDGDSVDVAFNLRFPGQYFDAENGLHYNRLRIYSTDTGRFLSADPVGQLGAGGANPYQYANSNPLFYFDPDGGEPRGERRQTGPGDRRANPGKKKPSYQPGRGGWGVKDNHTGKFKPLSPQPPPPKPQNPEPWREHPDYKDETQDAPATPDPSPESQFSSLCDQNPALCDATVAAAIGAARAAAFCASAVAGLFGFGT